ncbi:hypothetical protein QVM41_28050 [Pseudomonas shirazica]|uniref:hypothetical protein n=1 Tax=Pseudomonas shirazica TaxID=1940636 RepID=UPI003526258A
MKNATLFGTEPPALLAKPMTVEFDAIVLDELNNYRKAQHAFYAAQAVDSTDQDELTRLQTKYEQAQRYLGNVVGHLVRAVLGEPMQLMTAEPAPGPAVERGEQQISQAAIAIAHTYLAGVLERARAATSIDDAKHESSVAIGYARLMADLGLLTEDEYMAKSSEALQAVERQ